MGELLRQQKFSLQANRKTREGDSHPDRDAQFAYINTEVSAALAEGQAVISVDTQEKGTRRRLQECRTRVASPRRAGRKRCGSFLIKELGRAVPYGIYDLASNAGWVSVAASPTTRRPSRSDDSPLVAGDRPRPLSRGHPTRHHRRRRRLQRLCVRLWKRELQRLAGRDRHRH